MFELRILKRIFLALISKNRSQHSFIMIVFSIQLFTHVQVHDSHQEVSRCCTRVESELDPLALNPSADIIRSLK